LFLVTRVTPEARPTGRVVRGIVETVAAPYPLGADALLGLLFPIWQLVIAGCVVAAVVVSAQRLRSRGPSRMATALVVTGTAIMCLTVLGLLLAQW
jgi:hypothetical protein